MPIPISQAKSAHNWGGTGFSLREPLG